MNSVSNTSPSFTCPICLDNDGIATGQFGGHTLVRTSCQPKPHVFHLGCITRWFHGEPQKYMRLDLRQCCECKQPALPLVRLDGSHILEDESSYCESLMLHVCRTGDLRKLNRLLALDASLATRKYRSALTGQPAHPLAVAIDSGHMDCAQTLIDHQADINAGDQDGQTPLHIAAENGNVQCLKWLVTRGANVNATNRNGETPLHIANKIGITEVYQQWAAMNRNIDEGFDNCKVLETYTNKKENDTRCLEELLANRELNVNVSDNNGVTPLMIAALWGKTERLKWLLDARADIYVNDQRGWTPLHFAALSDRAEIVNMLLAVVPGINVGKEDIYGYTALHLAAENDSVEPLKVLLNTPGIRVNKKTNNGFTALHIAAMDENPDSVKALLVTPGIRVNKKSKKGWTALHLAAEYNSAKAIKALLATPGIRVNEKVDGRTALHIAAKYGKPKCVKALLATAGILINEQTDDGLTALDLAVSHGHRACMELLREACQDISGT
ncbi:ankyrin repeat domain-containing protein [Endozoicomonas sp. SESOKO1]|uniref:ankyrin repeat domain-containing protein n=1 Tax=Endozoicomonas sp. SESOKO1 TaxID=2828742 RepID=UPI00214854CD|nr:ankyrin repeat domain-containing protein [Endozoicomonas sp. SESOKO1]